MAKDAELNILDCLDSTVKDLIDNNMGLVSLCRELLAKDLDKYANLCNKILYEAEIINNSIMALNQLEIELTKAYLE